ncbi:MAG: hypothetical protein RIR26_701 [Pseudomonadota bacterium]|jgi:hypothetical protein
MSKKMKIEFKVVAVFSALSVFHFATSCGQKKTTSGAAETPETLHVNLSVHPSTMLLGAPDTLISEVTIQRFSCPDASDPVDYSLKQVQSEKVFVLNESRAVLEGCSLRIRSIKLTSGKLTFKFDAAKDQFTAVGTSETVLSNSAQNAFLNAVIPTKVPLASEKNIFWPLMVSAVDSTERLFPLMVEAREAGVPSLGLSVSHINDRGTLNTTWREFGVALSCGAPSALGSCNGQLLRGMTARMVLQSDVDLGSADQIRLRGSLNDFLFTAGLSHLLGSGLRFTLTLPLSQFGQPQYLIVMKGRSYSVFKVLPDSVPSANANQ